MDYFKHSAFVSWRNGEKDKTTNLLKDDLLNEFAIQLHDALQDELHALTNKGIFIDIQNIDGAYYLKAKFSEALCHSACYILIYTPAYFNAEKLYCTAEFLTMKEIERQRHMILGQTNPLKSLIIPIILRGKEYLPSIFDDIAYRIEFHNWIDTDRKIKKNKEYAGVINDIANNIFKLYKEFEPHATTMMNACKDNIIKDTETDREELIKFIEENNLAHVAKELLK